MGANAQTTVPTFTAGEVLTAAQMNNSARTGVPVFATTITRDAGFGGTGEKTLAEGQMCYVEGTGFQTYNGTSWVTWGTAPSSGALTLISSTTIGSAVSSVAVTSVFSSTYDNYKIIISGGSGSTIATVSLQLGSTTTGYYMGYSRVAYSTAGANLASNNNAASWTQAGAMDTNGITMNVDVLAPNLARKTVVGGPFGYPTTSGAGGGFGGFLDDTTAYTAFTIAPSTGTMTGGTIKVYGYKN